LPNLPASAAAPSPTAASPFPRTTRPHARPQDAPGPCNRARSRCTHPAPSNLTLFSVLTLSYRYASAASFPRAEGRFTASSQEPRLNRYATVTLRWRSRFRFALRYKQYM